jgi:hypothetical protein
MSAFCRLKNVSLFNLIIILPSGSTKAERKARECFLPVEKCFSFQPNHLSLLLI